MVKEGKKGSQDWERNGLPGKRKTRIMAPNWGGKRGTRRSESKTWGLEKQKGSGSTVIGLGIFPGRKTQRAERPARFRVERSSPLFSK